MIDVKIVAAAQQGDKESFAQVYDWFALDLYKVALYTLGNSHDAEDVVSETFIEAYKGIKNLREPEKVKSWMMRILSIRCKRKIGEYIQGRQETDIDSMLVPLVDETMNLSEDVVEMVALSDAMGRLSHEERLIISLSAVQGYTTREIAEYLNTPHGTVSSKLHRALAKVRKLLEVPENDI